MRVAAFSFCVLLWLAACATPDRTRTDTAPAKPAASAAPRYNLTGYSPAFKAGHADACAVPRRRSEARFKNEDDYRMGWQDGASVCKQR